MNYQFLTVDIQQAVAQVCLNRPDVHNAFNAQLIAELHDCFTQLNERYDCRVIVLSGRGKSFSAGADLQWMQQAALASQADNQADALKLAKMLQAIAKAKAVTIAKVQGAALGGGMGLAAVCDICIASDKASFATTEVRLGLAPSTISPYVIRAIGPRQAYRYFLTAERICAEKAQHLGLVHELATAETLDQCVDQMVQSLLLGGPVAQQASKQLIEMVSTNMNDYLLEETAKHIATLRQGSEAKAGVNAFLNKIPAPWLSSAQ